MSAVLLQLTCRFVPLSAHSRQTRLSRTAGLLSTRPHARAGRAVGATPQPGRMNLRNTLKTWTLMALLGGLLVAVGGLVGGQTGIVFALGFAVLLNGFVYWKSDSLALRANGARPLGPDEEPRVHAIITVVAK